MVKEHQQINKYIRQSSSVLLFSRLRTQEQEQEQEEQEGQKEEEEEEQQKL